HDQVEAMTLADRIVILKDGRIEQQGRPIDIYSEPCNRFVAEFIGSPQMNIFSGVLIDDGAQLAVTIGNTRLSIGPIKRGESGDEVLVGIRPEHLLLGQGANQLSCAVDLIEPTGSDTTILSSLDAQEFSARIPADFPVNIGQLLDFTIACDRIHLFDKQTNVRINHSVL
ncbi:MAG: TOBE domain-containing protein, partial [Granulosicoccus sp.]